MGWFWVGDGVGEVGLFTGLVKLFFVHWGRSLPVGDGVWMALC